MSEKIALNLEREGIKLASIQKRAFAFIIDELVVFALFMAAYWDLLKGFATHDELVMAISGLVFQYIAIRTIYHTFFVWYYAATIGKLIVKIACIDVEYLDKPSFALSLTRALVRNLSETCFYLGFLWALSNPIRQTWQDKFSKMVVIDVA